MSAANIADWSTFQDFVQVQLRNEIEEVSLEEGLARFRAYQQDLNALRAKLKIAEEQSARGEAQPLDIEQFVGDLRDRIAAHRRLPAN